MRVIIAMATNLSHEWVLVFNKIAFSSVYETFTVDVILSKPTGLKNASQ